MKALVICLTAGTLVTAAGPSMAGPKCTEEPTSKWFTEAQMMIKIEAMGYKDIRNFHVSKGRCYEIYGYDKGGRKVEVYFHPISGEIVEAKVQ